MFLYFSERITTIILAPSIKTKNPAINKNVAERAFHKL